MVFRMNVCIKYAHLCTRINTGFFYRYILVDWLVEVACMKNFSTLTLHNAVSIVDHFLAVRDVPRSKLQLLGVSAMVISSR